MELVNTVTVKNVTIGDGIPKICVPIVAYTKGQILADAFNIVSSRVDIVEWRADWFESATNIEKVKDVLKGLSSVLNQIPLLFTLRTAREGGKIALDPESYARINKAVIATGWADLVDIEILKEEIFSKDILESAHAVGVKVIGSSHQFDGTPSQKEMIDRLRKMQDMGADISKIAVMPKNETDVIRLLEAAAIMNEKYAKRPIAAISMARLGVVSRITGEIFGSALTFGSVKKESAPGQIESEKLYQIMQGIHRVL